MVECHDLCLTLSCVNVEKKKLGPKKKSMDFCRLIGCFFCMFLSNEWIDFLFFLLIKYKIENITLMRPQHIVRVSQGHDLRTPTAHFFVAMATRH